MPNKVTVRIWIPEQDTVVAAMAKGVGVGHASITLVCDGEKHYITWMAQGNPLQWGDIDPYVTIASFKKAQDKANMQGFFGKSEPRYKIKLPTKQPDSDAPGLDAHKIKAYWEDRLLSMPKYCFMSVRNNCTGCVADALRAGGLEQWVAMPPPFFVQNASSLLGWVLEARQKMGPADQHNESF